MFNTINRQPIFCQYTRIRELQLAFKNWLASPFTHTLMDIRSEFGCLEQLAGKAIALRPIVVAVAKQEVVIMPNAKPVIIVVF